MARAQFANEEPLSEQEKKRLEAMVLAKFNATSSYVERFKVESQQATITSVEQFLLSLRKQA